MTYPLTFYVNSLPSNFSGESRGPVIRILEENRDDYGLYRHELQHVKQWFLTLGLHSLLYLLVPRYRLWSEVQCYKEQAKHYEDDRRPIFAEKIATKYGLDISTEEALRLLSE